MAVVTIEQSADDETMAKKQPGSKPKAAPEPKQRTLFAIKGDEAFLEWVRELSDHVGLPMTYTMDMALKRYAEHVKFPKPMPKRTK